MKWLFIIAALLNVAYFAYNSFFDKEVIIQDTVSNVSEKNQITLLSELDANALKNLQNKVAPKKSDQEKSLEIQPPEPTQIELSQAPENNQTEIVSENNLCFNLGPFDKKKLDDIRLALEKSYHNKLSFRIETTSTTTYYRIYIPPVETREVRNETLALLNKHGLEDNYVMSIDGRKNAIALGVFKKRSAAETIAAKASKIGLSTTIEAISDDKNSLYKLQLVFQQNLDMKDYNELLEKNNLESSRCENKG